MRSWPPSSLSKRGFPKTKPLCFSTRFSKVFNCIPAVLWSPLHGQFVQPEGSRMHLFQTTFTHRFSRRPLFYLRQRGRQGRISPVAAAMLLHIDVQHRNIGGADTCDSSGLSEVCRAHRLQAHFTFPGQPGNGVIIQVFRNRELFRLFKPGDILALTLHIASVLHADFDLLACLEIERLRRGAPSAKDRR